MEYSYHQICEALPYRPKLVESLAENMKAKGYLDHEEIVLFEGSILDGRHRYEASGIAKVEPQYREFVGTPQEAAAWVLSTNIENRRHLNNKEKMSAALSLKKVLGVRSKGGDNNPSGSNQYKEDNRTNVLLTTSEPEAPSQKDYASMLGVDERTVRRWFAQEEKETKEKALEDAQRKIKKAKQLAEGRENTPEGQQALAKAKKTAEEAGLDVDDIKTDKQREEEYKRKQEYDSKNRRSTAEVSLELLELAIIHLSTRELSNCLDEVANSKIKAALTLKGIT